MGSWRVSSCSRAHCAVGAEAAQVYFAIWGTIIVREIAAEHGGRLLATIENLRLRHVQYDALGNQSDNPSNCIVAVDKIDVDLSVQDVSVD